MSVSRSETAKAAHQKRKIALWRKNIFFLTGATVSFVLVVLGWNWAAHLVPWLALLAAIIAVTAFAIGARWGAAPWAAAALMLGVPVAASLLPHFPPSATGCRFSVLTFNTKLTRGPQEDRIADVIFRNPADILLLQEVMRPSVLRDTLRAKPAFSGYHTLASDGNGLLILSRFPIAGPIEFPAGLGVEIRVSGQPARVLTGVGSRNHDNPLETSTLFSGIIAAISGAHSPLIFGGDLNAGPFADGPRRLRGGLSDAFATAGWGFGFTFPAPGRSIGRLGAFLRTDYVWAESIFQPAAAEVPADFGGSTHYPLKVEYIFTGVGVNGAECAGS